MNQKHFQNHLDNQENENKSYLTREVKYKRPLALGEIFDLQESLKIMRKNYKTLGHYDKVEMEKNAKTIKERIKKQTTQYKIYCKQRTDDFGREVVEALF